MNIKKIFTSMVCTLVAALSFAGGDVTLRAPRSMKPDGIGVLSVGTQYDGSLLKGVVFFDNFSSQYMAVSYDIGQVEGLLPKPIRVGLAGAFRGDEKAWGGLAASYELINTGKFSIGAVVGLPGFEFTEMRFSLPEKIRFYPGLNFSVRFSTS